MNGQIRVANAVQFLCARSGQLPVVSTQVGRRRMRKEEAPVQVRVMDFLGRPAPAWNDNPPETERVWLPPQNCGRCIGGPNAGKYLSYQGDYYRLSAQPEKVDLFSTDPYGSFEVRIMGAYVWTPLSNLWIWKEA